jgi:hypothetical protein
MGSFRRNPHSRLVFLYAALVAFGHFVHALPGGWFYRSSGDHAFWVAVDVVLIFLIARRSRAAIALAFALNMLGFLAFLSGLAGVPDPAVAAFVAVVFVQTAVLVLLWRETSVTALRGQPAA